ncbi:hypothetical protein [Ralstonia pseudosolanacearum]|uniref:hypothetical protein n=1 Tax=Ralstonia pseudosolanacearum TaxID=1310165 RepID=UPI001FF951D1|nr:hypothetical protein [Ralstonia pseudosolanacearum]
MESDRRVSDRDASDHCETDRCDTDRGGEALGDSALGASIFGAFGEDVRPSMRPAFFLSAAIGKDALRGSVFGADSGDADVPSDVGGAWVEVELDRKMRTMVVSSRKTSGQRAVRSAALSPSVRQPYRHHHPREGAAAEAAAPATNPPDHTMRRMPNRCARRRHTSP